MTQRIYSREEVEAIRLQLAAITHLDGIPVFQVRIESGTHGCFIKLANQDTEENLYFRLQPAPRIVCRFCGETHDIIG